MSRGTNNIRDDIYMSPALKVPSKSFQSRMRYEKTDNKRHNEINLRDQFSSEGHRHLQERNPPPTNHGRPQRPNSEYLCQENIYPHARTGSLNLSDTDKLTSGIYGQESVTSNDYRFNFGQPLMYSTMQGDWPSTYGGTSVSCGSLSPIGDGSMSIKPTHRGGSPTSQQRNVDTVKKIADDIIKEKDSIIESQCQKLEDLEAHLKSLSWQETLLRDLERENQLLKRQIQNNNFRTQNNIGLSTSPAVLEEQLCALEYKLSEHKKSSEKNQQLKDARISELSKELTESRDDAERMERKLRERDDELESVRKEVEKMYKYMGDLPPVEEHKDNLKKIDELKDLLAKNEKVLQERSARLKERSKVIESKDREIIKLKEEMNEMKKCVEQVQSENMSLHEEVSTSFDLMDRRKSKETNDKLVRELDTLKKVYEAKVKQLQLKLSEEVAEKNSLREMLTDSERNVESLGQDVMAHEINADDYLKTFKELKDKCESLTSDLERVKGEKKYLQGLKSEQECRMFKDLLNDLNSAFEELQAIIKICKERADNKEPSLDDLLGTKSLTAKINQDEYVDDSIQEMLEKKCQQVIELRRDIDFLRGELADLIAEDLGRRLTCSMQ